MKKLTLFVIIFSLFTNVIIAQSGGIRAKVIDLQGKPLAFATVLLKTDKLIEGKTTDIDGWFTFKGLSQGTYNIQISFIGYKTRIIPGITVNSGSMTFLDNIKIAQQNQELPVATIRGRKLIDPSDPSANKMDAKILKSLPGNNNMGNIMRTVSPDIQVTADNKDIIVRGSRPGNSAFYVDGVRSTSMSPINGKNIRSMTVYSGGIPAKYGDITGGVVIIETKGYFDFYYEWRAKHQE